jgi:hypothetical protein
MQRLLQLAILTATLALDGYVRFGSIADAPSLARAGGSCQMPKRAEKIIYKVITVMKDTRQTHNDRIMVMKIKLEKPSPPLLEGYGHGARADSRPFGR